MHFQYFDICLSLISEKINIFIGEQCYKILIKGQESMDKPMGKTLKGSLIVVIMLLLSTTCLSVLASESFIIHKNVEKPLDSNREIITFIDGSCNEITIKGLGFVRRAEIWTGDIKTMVTLDGYKFPFLIDGIRNHFTIDYASHIIIPHFIGIRWKASTVSYWVHGIALGNIDWE